MSEKTINSLLIFGGEVCFNLDKLNAGSPILYKCYFDDCDLTLDQFKRIGAILMEGSPKENQENNQRGLEEFFYKNIDKDMTMEEIIGTIFDFDMDQKGII